MKKTLVLLALVALASPAFADDSQVYKWTDAAGVIHYSDKAPAQPAADLQAMDMPAFPVQDPAKLAAQQAELIAEVQATQKLLQAQLDQEAQSAALRAQQAQFSPQPQVDSSPSVAPIYVNSAFVPRAYRANLYVPHRSANSRPSRPQTTPPAMTLQRKP